jgi:hypothetical protein
MNNIQQRRQTQGGNVLFLILIAVALFAALSYVVTQSTRSGSGSADKEKNILSSAQMTQYPTALRTSLIRMVLAGVGIEQIVFNSPSDAIVSTNLMVFHPSGGAAGYQDAPADLSATGTATLRWWYNANFDVPGVGIDGSGGNDVIAFLPGVSDGVCKQVNEELGIDVTDCTLSNGVPTAVAGVDIASVREDQDDNYTFPTADMQDLQCDGAAVGEAFSRKASGCMKVGTDNVFYSVLLER